jgi:hypothetical protein
LLILLAIWKCSFKRFCRLASAAKSPVFLPILAPATRLIFSYDKCEKKHLCRGLSEDSFRQTGQYPENCPKKTHAISPYLFMEIAYHHNVDWWLTGKIFYFRTL